METTKNRIPTTLVKGFLEAGKSTYIQNLLQREYQTKDNTLLLSFEEGEIPYDPALLQKLGVTLIEIEDEELLNREYLEQLSARYSPSHIIIETNTMWKMVEFELPRSWQIDRRIAIVSGSTLGLYLDNMRSFMGPMLSRCDQIIINRCDDFEQLSALKSKLRPLLDNPSKVVLEATETQYGFEALKDQAPYDLNRKPIIISPANYVYWFYDCQDNPRRYEGKHLSLQGSIKKSPILKTGEFALGKLAITCCEADMSFLGYIAHFDSIDNFSQFANVQAEAVVTYRYQQQYQKVMPYLKVLQMEAAVPSDEVVSYQ